MSRPERSARPAWTWVACGAGLLVVLGCGSAKDENAHYRTRGQVVSVSEAESRTHALIHHERIAAFKDRDGQASPMESMQMNFLLAPEVDAAAFKPGAKLAIEFDVRWSSGDALVITHASPLAETTTLSLSQH